MMEKTTVGVRVRAKGAGIDTFDVPGYTTPTPGLVVHKGYNGAGRWTVTHAASGYMVTNDVRTRALAVTIAEALAPLGDWTLPTADDVSRAIDCVECSRICRDHKRADARGY